MALKSYVRQAPRGEARAAANVSDHCTSLASSAWRALLAVGALVFGGLPEARPAEAADILVTSTNDSGAGSLRAAIQASNASTGVFDTIKFSIGGGGVQTIALLSPLPTITDPVSIDGTTQPGFSGTPLIDLNGASAGANTIGLAITAGSSTVRGLVLRNFGGGGISLASGGNTVAGNYIGTDVTGSIAQGNGLAGVTVLGPNNVIGGPLGGNLISGNTAPTANGLRIAQAGVGTVVQGNQIGINAAGTAALPNGNNGIFVESSNNTIGGTTGSAVNIVSGNGGIGLNISENAPFNVVRGYLLTCSVRG